MSHATRPVTGRSWSERPSRPDRCGHESDYSCLASVGAATVADMTDIPETNVDLFTDEALSDPYPLYQELRALGPVVRLAANEMYAFPRYRQVREASMNWDVFSSARGVMMNPEINAQLEGITLCSDPPEHTQMRNVLGRPLRPERLREQIPKIEAAAESIVERLVSRGTFDAATELAEHLPMDIVSDLVGLGEAGRDRMLDWAAATFDAQGPMNRRTRDSFPKLEEMVGFAMNEAVPGELDPDGWAAELYAAAANGELPVEKCPFMMIDYIAPSLDTTIYAISSAVYLFAQNPGQWTTLRKDPTLIPHAINEALRLESPVQRFTRFVTRNHEIDGTLAAGRVPRSAPVRLGQPGRAQVPRPGPLRHPPQAVGPPGLRPRRACVHRHEPGPDPDASTFRGADPAGQAVRAPGIGPGPEQHPPRLQHSQGPRLRVMDKSVAWAGPAAADADLYGRAWARPAPLRPAPLHPRPRRPPQPADRPGPRGTSRGVVRARPRIPHPVRRRPDARCRHPAVWPGVRCCLLRLDGHREGIHPGNLQGAVHDPPPLGSAF